MRLPTRWIWMYQGFSQDPGEEHGLEQLYYQLRKDFYKTPIEIRLHGYDDRIEEHVVQIRRRPAPVALIGFSLGGGAAVRTAYGLAAAGIRVDELMLIDPVGDPLQTPGLRWLSRMIHAAALPTLQLPENVHRLWHWRQTRNYPRGNELAKHPDTKRVVNAQLRLPRHQDMDALPSIHKTIRAALTRFIFNPTPRSPCN